MRKTSDVLATVRMLQEENLDVRTVTMGINLNCCMRATGQQTAMAVKDRIRIKAENLVRVCDHCP
jgi:uncharacterized protein